MQALVATMAFGITAFYEPHTLPISNLDRVSVIVLMIGMCIAAANTRSCR